MVKGDIFTAPINFALERTINDFKNTEDENEEIILESLRRAKKMWESIRINGIEICGMTFEEFCDQCDEKKNIVFMTDEEMEKYNRALKLWRY